MKLWFLFAIVICSLVYAQGEDINNTTTASIIQNTNNNNEGVCNINEGCCQCTTNQEDDTSDIDYEEEEATTIRILSVGGSGFAVIKKMVEDDAKAFEDEMNGLVNIIVEEVDTLIEMANEIRVNAALENGFYDGFVSNPGVVGSAVASRPPGFMDLGDFVRESAVLDWLDILPAFREVITTYDGKVYMLPLDGDVHSMFYRRDILDYFNLTVPRTWDEYVEVAKATHGQTYNGTKLNGSCIGRVESCVGAYYANLVLASITQTDGFRSGHLFNPKDMSPLAGEALGK